MNQVAQRLAEVRERIAVAARMAGRDAASVRLVAVTKKLDVGAVRAAYEAGVRDFGENYVQEAVAKIDEFGEQDPPVRWHMLGHLQSNKAAVAAARFSLLHGIDSLSTAAALSRAATRQGRTVSVLMQVRLGDRAGGRSGVDPSAAAEFLERATAEDGIRFVGLMGVADPDLEARPQFAGLRELATRLSSLGLERAPLGELSMGMTGDFEAAVAEGATLVRIGTAIFGERPAR